MSERAISTGRQRALPGEQCSRRRIVRQDVERRGFGSLASTHTGSDQAVIDGNPVGCELLPVSLMAKRGSGDGLQIAEIADPPVAVPKQMADAAARTIQVVGEDIVSVEKGGWPVDKHHRRA